MTSDPFGNPKRDFKPADSARNTFYWPDNLKGDNLVWRLPRNIHFNDNVVIREDENVVFFRDGKALTVFDRPGRYALTTQNIPILASLLKVTAGIEQIGEAYWIQKREFRGRFKAENTLTFRDIDFGLVRIIASGQFAYQVTDPILFITQFIGTKGLQHSDQIIDWLKDQILMILNSSLGKLKSEKNMGILDMPTYLTEIEQICLSRLKNETSPYGLKVTKFSGLMLQLPDSVQEAIDKRSAMAALGVNFLQYQTANAIGGIGEGAAKGGDAAGFAGIGAGLGAGFGISQVVAQNMYAQQNQSIQPIGGVNVAPIGQQQTQTCPKCGYASNLKNKFCPECGTEMQGQGNEGTKCRACGKPIPPKSKFCLECGEKQIQQCTKCQQEIPYGIKYCPNCGNKMDE
ncbi:SPFH domain-containing protein [Methanoculleus sp. UBA430]|uniref:SPFH domain-containing protein n=1 Tax=Methanoculleus sp. UBA430 TaxID=1915511 RepID=UPI0025D9E238|nr:SPFH domain-containing protein [Methanoculleus sp. UBA430]